MNEWNMMNTRAIRKDGTEFPDFASSAANLRYVCLTHKQRDSISATIFKKKLELTHPSVQNNDQEPPGDTVIIEVDIRSSKSKFSKTGVDRVLRYVILTTGGDAHVL